MDATKIASLKRLQHGRTQMNDLVAHMQHICDPLICNPLSEIDMIRRGLLQGPVICNNIWLCRYGSYHICSASECSRANEGSCPISGATFLEFGHQQADYDEQDSRTWKPQLELAPLSVPDPHLDTFTRKRRKNLRDSAINLFDDAPPEPMPIPEEEEEEEEPIVVKKTKFRTNGRLGKPEAKRRIEKMITTLLFDSAPRRAAAFQQMAYIEDKRAKRWRQHVQKCREENLIVNLIEQMIIDSNMTSLIPPPITPYIEVNLEKQNYYVKLLMELYDKACIYLPQPKVDVEAMALAALYCMRGGYSVGGIVVLQADKYLAENLPQVSDLPTFKYPKKKITKGTKLVKELFARAQQKGERNSDLQMQMSIPTANVIRDTQPERLFMPTSRRRKFS